MMMSKSFVKSYKFYGVIFFTFIIIFSIGGIYFLNSNFFHKNDEIYYGSYLDKERTFKNMLSQYETSLTALQSNKLFNDFVIYGKNKEELLELFLFTKKSFLHITQIRFLDPKGEELLRVEGDAISVFYDEAKSIIVKDKDLQNKAKSDYFKNFMKAEPLDIAYSKITLNKEHEKITLPKEPTLRMGIKVYGNSTKLQGILIYNISLRSFFLDMYNHFIHEFYIVDSKGNFIFHNNLKYGLLGDSKKYTIKDEFPTEYENIMNTSEYHSSNFHSYELKSISNPEKIILIIKDKTNH